MAMNRAEKTRVGLMDRSGAGVDKGQTTGGEVNNQEGQRACGYRPKGLTKRLCLLVKLGQFSRLPCTRLPGLCLQGILLTWLQSSFKLQLVVPYRT